MLKLARRFEKAANSNQLSNIFHTVGSVSVTAKQGRARSQSGATASALMKIRLAKKLLSQSCAALTKQNIRVNSAAVQRRQNAGGKQGSRALRGGGSRPAVGGGGKRRSRSLIRNVAANQPNARKH